MTEAGGAGRDKPELRGINEVAAELGITHRTLRFYEDKGLIEPERVGTTRVYTRRAVARMRLILRGKRLGFSLREIRDFLDLYDADPQHLEHARALRALVTERIGNLEKQRAAIDQTIVEMQAIEREAAEWLRHPHGDAEGGEARETSAARTE